MKREQIGQYILWLAMFLLPWQTRLIYSEMTLQGEVWEYGKLGIYAVEVLIVLAAILLGRPRYQFCVKRVTGLGIMFLGAGFLSVSTALNSSLGIGAILHLVVAVMLFMILLDRRVDVFQVSLALVTGLILPSILGWWQVITGTSPSSTLLGLANHEAQILGQSVVETAGSDRILRAYGSFSHPNVFGGYLAMTSLFCIWLMNQVKEYRFVLGGGLMILLPTLVITFSRSAWLAFILGLGVMIGSWWWHKQKITKDVWRFGAVALVLTVVVMGIFSEAMFTRVQSQARLETKSIEERAGEYDSWFSVVKINPLTGVGMGNYTLGLAQLNPDQPAYVYQPMHNAFLLMVGEIGLIGLMILGWWFWQVFKSAKLTSGMWCGLVALVPLVLFDHYLWSSWSGLAIGAFFMAVFVRMNQVGIQT